MSRLSRNEIINIVNRLENGKSIGIFRKDLSKYVSYSYEFLSRFDYWNFNRVSGVADIIGRLEKEEIAFNKTKLITHKEAVRLYSKKNYLKREQEEKYAKDFFNDVREFLRTERIFITPKIYTIIAGIKPTDDNNQYYDINGHIVFTIKLNKHYTDYFRLETVIKEDFLKNKGFCEKVSRVEVKDGVLRLEIW